MSNAIETAKNETEAAKQAVSVRIPADVARQFRARDFARFEQVGTECRVSTPDRSISWESIDDETFTVASGKLPSGWIDLAKACVEVEVALDTSLEVEPIIEFGLSTRRLIFSRDELAWVAKACDTDATRFALGGVAITDNGRLIATDGRRLHLSCPDTYPVAPVADDPVVATIPAESVAAALKLSNKKQSHIVVFLFDKPADSESFSDREFDRCQLHVSRRDISERFVVSSRLLDGRFPKWEQVIPAFDSVDGERGQFDPIDKSELRKIRAIAKSEEKTPIFPVGSAEFDADFLNDIGHSAQFTTNKKAEGAYRFDFESFGRFNVAIVMPLHRDKR